MLTLEDVNSCLQRNGTKSIVHAIDTSTVNTDEFVDVKLDFCIVSHSINGEDHTFTFEVVNSSWSGAYYFTDVDDNYLDSDAQFSDDVISFTTSLDCVKLVLYCSHIAEEFVFNRIDCVPLDLDDLIITRADIGSLHSFNFLDVTDGSSFVESVTLTEGINRIGDFYFMVYLRKVDLVCNPNADVVVGKVNRVRLNVAGEFLPGGELVGDDLLSISTNYNGEDIACYFDSVLNDYCFDLDLTNMVGDRNVNLVLVVGESEFVNHTDVSVKLVSDYLSVDNFSDLYNEIMGGTEIIQLGEDIEFLARINVSHDLIIYGNGYTFDLNEYGFNLLEGSVLKIENLQGDNGDTVIMQARNTKVELTGCKFTNCKSSNYNNLGSVVFCDVNMESLSNVDDFVTNITDCTFIDNHNILLHGGELTINNVKYHNTDSNYADNNNPAFLYQTDGTVDIVNSIFDIDYTDNNLCSNEINIGYAQALIMCGETAIINEVTHDYLTEDNKLPFFDAPYNNKSHVFAKYYYPQINECVYSSPQLDLEDKSVCYCVSNQDWIYKQGVQVTKATDNIQNTNHKIIWEE